MFVSCKNLNPSSRPFQGGALGSGWTTPPLKRGGRAGLQWISQ